MQPNNPFEQEPSGIDYLNHIATPSQPTGFDRKSKLILVIAGVIGVLSLGFIALTANMQSNSGPSPLTLVARLQKLDQLSSTYGGKLRTTALQDANSSLSAVLITANQAITEPLAAYEIDVKKQAKEITALDPVEEINQTLDDAHLNSMLDVVYAREMNFQLEETLVMMNRLSQTTRVESMKVFLDKTIADFENLQKRFAEALAN